MKQKLVSEKAFKDAYKKMSAPEKNQAKQVLTNCQANLKKKKWEKKLFK